MSGRWRLRSPACQEDDMERFRRPPGLSEADYFEVVSVLGQLQGAVMALDALPDVTPEEVYAVVGAWARSECVRELPAPPVVRTLVRAILLDLRQRVRLEALRTVLQDFLDQT
jgi:hypothetical protein